MSKSYLSLLIFSAVFSLFVTSCKNDDAIKDQTIIEVDFLLNERDLERYGLDYTEQELERDMTDPNKVLRVRAGEPVKFKDTSKGGSSSVTSRKWVLNENEWKIDETNKGVAVPEFTHVFEDPGYYRISLYVGEVSYATKLVNVVSGDFVAEEQDLNTLDVNPPSQTDDLVASDDNATPTRPQPSTPVQRETPSQPATPKPAAAEPVKVNSVNFVAPQEAIVGQSIEVKDISSPASAVQLRQWDLGDGTTQRTKGSTYRHMYFSPGQKLITLCLNNTDQCVTKTITVKPRPEPVAEVEKPATPKPADPPAPKKVEIAKVEFSMPSTAVVGTSVDLADKTSPASAVLNRKWSFGDGTPDLNTGKSAISHVFNKAGKFKVTVCVNDSDLCNTQEITITEKPSAVVAEKPAASTGGFDISSYSGEKQGRVGLLSSQKCDDQTFEWFSGTATINITPKQGMELDEAKVYANKNGLLDFILKDGKGTTVGSVNNVQVNPGSSIVYLTDMAVIMRPGEKYTLTVKPSNDGSGLQLENSVKCSPNPLKSEVVDVNYNKNFILYDLRFYY